MSLKIITFPHPTLRHRSRPLKRVDAELRQMVAEMFDLMYEHKGVGLAANQVNLPYRLFVANPEGDPDVKEAEHVFLNPVISSPRGSSEAEEGCLSIPGVYAPVVRPERIKVQAFNLKGEEFDGELDGFFGRVVQHESDHLDGTLFIDRLSPTVELSIRDRLAEFQIEFDSKRQTGELPDDAAIASYLQDLEAART